MTTRRNFLASNLAGAAGWAWHVRPEQGAAAGFPEPSEPSRPLSDRDFWNDWPGYLTEKMNQARRKRKAALAAVQTRQQVLERSAAVREKVWELIGGPLEKTPLNPQITGSIDRGAYRIEKVIFESLPEVYVTANLYVPGSGTPPFPAILAPLGHTEEGKAYRNYQYLYQNLARKGYVVLAFDPYGQGERVQYLNPQTGRSRYGPTGEHSQAGRPLILLGDTFALYRAWDGIRALDYLVSRAEVDGNRLGCTGHSGGGTMTMYLAALEPRLRAAVEVEGNSENLAGPFYDPPGATDDAEQDLVGSLPFGIDRGDLLWAFAPKPLLVCYTTHDEGETYSPVYEESTREIYQELQHGYGLLGASERVGLFASHLPHDMDFFQRRETYGWFNRWLENPEAGTGEAEFDASPPGTLNCTSTGQVLTSLGGRTVVQVNWDRARKIMGAASLRKGPNEAAILRPKMADDLASLLALPSGRSSLRSKLLSSNAQKNTVIEEFQFESEPGIRVPGWFVSPQPEVARRPTILYLSSGGGGDLVAEPGAMDRVLGSGHAVCAITLRGLGVAMPRFPKAGPRYYGGTRNMRERFAWAGLALSLPVVGQRVWDALRAVDFLAARPDVISSQIRILGTGDAGLVALMATVLDERVRAVLLNRNLVSYASIIKSEKYSLELEWFVPGVLRKFDLPDLVAALSPRPCWVLNGVDPLGQVLPEVSVGEHYGQPVNSGTSPSRNVRIFVEPERDPQDRYLEWLSKT